MFDLFVRLMPVDLSVQFFVRFHVRILSGFVKREWSILSWFCTSDFFVRLLHVRFSLSDSFVLFFVQFILSDLFLSDFFLIFLTDFMSDFCPIFVPFSMSDFLFDLFVSDFLCPILLSSFWPIYFARRVHVRFFVLLSLSDFLLYFLPDLISRLFVRFLSSFFGRFVVTFFWMISRQKRSNMSCIATFCHDCQCVSVFIIMTVSYTRMGVM